MNDIKGTETPKSKKKTLDLVYKIILKTANFILWLFSAVFFIMAFLVFNGQGFLLTLILVGGSVMLTPSFKRILAKKLQAETTSSALIVHLIVTGFALGVISFGTSLYDEEKQKQFNVEYKELTSKIGDSYSKTEGGQEDGK